MQIVLGGNIKSRGFFFSASFLFVCLFFWFVFFPFSLFWFVSVFLKTLFANQMGRVIYQRRLTVNL